MNTLIKSFVRKYSTVALNSTTPFVGFKYDDIDTSKNYPLRSLLTQVLGNRIDDGFHMAYEQFIQALQEKDHYFLSTICTPTLQRQLEKHAIQIHNLNNDTKDIIYSDLTVMIGDRTQQCIKLSLFDCINLDIYGSDSQRQVLDNVSLRVECYVLSQLVLQPDQQFDSIYHRILFESRLTQACKKSPNFIQYLLCGPKKKIKYLRNHFMGKQFEWRILEIDNL